MLADRHARSEFSDGSTYLMDGVRARAVELGIDINISSFRYGLPGLRPSTEILRLAHDGAERHVRRAENAGIVAKRRHLDRRVGACAERPRGITLAQLA